MIKKTIPLILSVLLLASMSVKASQPYVEHVPASSAAYFSLFVSPESPLDNRVLKQYLRDIQLGDWASQPDLAEPVAVVERVLIELTQNGNNLAQRYGGSEHTDIGIYVDGAFPVVQFNILHPQQFNAEFTQLMLELGYANVGQSHGFTFWQLNDVWRLWLDVTAERVSLSLAPAMVTAKRLNKLLGQEPEAKNITTTWEAYEQPFHQRQGGSLMWYNLYELAKIWARQGDARVRSDLSYVPYILEDYYSNFSLACNDELIELASGLPYFASEVVENRIVDGTWSRQHEGIIALSHPRVAALTTLLNGHLSPVPDGNPVAHLAYGINVNNLPSVINGFANLLAEKHFQCPALAEIQKDILSSDRSGLAALNLLQGLQGASLTVFDLAFSDTGAIEGLDMILTVTSVMAEMNKMMMQSMSPHGELGAPQDNMLAPVPDLAEIWPTARWGRYGDHFVILDGEKSEHSIAQLTNAPVNNEGIMLFHFDVDELKTWGVGQDQINGAFQQLETELADDSQVCSMGADELFSVFGQMGSMKALMAANKDGFIMQGSDTVSMSTLPWRPIETGLYSIERQNAECQWVSAGQERLMVDGRQFNHSNGQCSTFAEQSNWQQYGYRLIFDQVRVKERQSCEAPWNEIDVPGQECVIIHQSDSGFTCLLKTSDGAEELVRYRLH